MTTEALRSPASDYGLLELDRTQCLALLTTEPVGRLVRAALPAPSIIPVGFVLHAGAVHVRTSRATCEDAVLAGVFVAFEADAFDAGTRTGWSVVVLGRPELVEDPLALEQVEGLLTRSWASGDRDSVLRIPVELVSGRRVGRGPLPALTVPPTTPQEHS